MALETPTQIPVTVIVPTLNEATNLASCLERLKRFEEVIVLDSGSTDGTVAIALAHGATVIDFSWNGKFPKKRNWYLRNFRPRCDWVLFLDADERVDEAFCAEIANLLPRTVHAGFEIQYRNWFLGVPLRHGELNLKLAIIRVGAGEYERTEDDSSSGLDMEVHEGPVIQGSVGRLKSVVDHHDYRGLEHWIRKHNQYSTWEARRLTTMRLQAATSASHLTARQRRKYLHLGKWWLPLAYFLATYVGKRGFMDGWAGFAFALNKAIYFWQVGLKARELRAPASKSPR
jgi:glycosyltransferase involved in cell wall biosynthesis